MKRRLGVLFSAIALTGSVLSGLSGSAIAKTEKAASCLQKQAMYTDADGAYLLRFFTPKDGMGMASNRFRLEVKDSKAFLDGWVVWGNGISRSHGTLNFQCPSGDITGEELDKCKTWEGVVYSVWPDGEVDLMPPADEPAAYKVMFPNLGQVLKYSSAWEKAKLTTVPWDVFKFFKCSK